MVTINLSTVSVITSIFVTRINAASSQLPRCVRAFVFRYVAPVLRVSASRAARPSTVSVDAEDASCGRTSTNHCSAKLTDTVDAAGASELVDPDARPASTVTDCCCQLKPQVDGVLYELRKVTTGICTVC